MAKRLIIIVSLILLALQLRVNLRGQNASGWDRIGTVDKASLQGIINNPMIASFDLSPDGKTIALLAFSGAKVGGSLWLVLQDVPSGKTVLSREIGVRIFPTGNFAPQVLFSADQRYLVVQNLQRVLVLNAANLNEERTIAAPPGQSALHPLMIIGAAVRDVFVCAFGAWGQFEVLPHATPAQLYVVDVSTGEEIASWKAEDVPQSISADGTLVAISSWQDLRNGVVPVAIFESSGKRIAEMDGGFSFRNAENLSKPIGRIIGIFVGNNDILLSPDGNTDSTGHRSGERLELVNLSNPVTRQDVRPSDFGPSGEMAISGDQKTLLAVSWRVPARVARHEHWPLPASSSPKVFILGRNHDFHVETMLSVHPIGLATGGPDTQRPRISSDGQLIAMAQNGGIAVLARSH